MDGQYNLELPIPLLPDAVSHPISPGAVAEGSGASRAHYTGISSTAVMQT